MPTLNVIFHGLFALVKQEDQVFALAPRVNDQHVYRAGPWLAEPELRQGFYMLTGVHRGQGVFKKTNNLILSHKAMSPQAPHQAYATIMLPQPKEVHSLCSVTVKKGEFTGTDAPKKDVNMATIQIFVYDCDDLSQIGLSGHPIYVAEDSTLPVFNLHLYSEEDVDPKDLNHSVVAFDEAIKLFSNVDLRLKSPQYKPSLPPDEVLPLGVHSLELEWLGHRQDRLNVLGQALRKILISGNSDYHELKKALDMPFTVGAEVQSCSFPILQES